jgi:hypothetical protein
MALNLLKLIDDLKAIKDVSTDGENNEDTALRMLAEAIDAFVKSGQVTGTSATGGAVTGKVT